MTEESVEAYVIGSPVFQIRRLTRATRVSSDLYSCSEEVQVMVTGLQ